MVLAAHNYDPYGTPDLDFTGFAFTGEMRDANNLQYHRARYYNPTSAIFTARDPYEGTMGDPLSLNRYGYVRGNPANLVDPSGLSYCSLDCVYSASPIASENVSQYNACVDSCEANKAAALA